MEETSEERIAAVYNPSNKIHCCFYLQEAIRAIIFKCLGFEQTNEQPSSSSQSSSSSSNSSPDVKEMDSTPSSTERLLKTFVSFSPSLSFCQLNSTQQSYSQTN